MDTMTTVHHVGAARPILGLTLAIAAIGAIALLPSLVRWWHRRRR